MHYDLCILCILWHDYAWQIYHGDFTRRRNTSELALFFHLAFVQHFSCWCPEAFCHEKSCDYFWEGHWENCFASCLQMQLAKLTGRPWGHSLLLRWLLPKHLHYVPTSAFQHPPVALAHLLLFSSMPAPEICGKKYIKRIKVDQLDVLRAQKTHILYCFVCTVRSSKLEALSHSSWDSLAQEPLSHSSVTSRNCSGGKKTQQFGVIALIILTGRKKYAKEVVAFNYWQQRINVPSSFVFFCNCN